MFAVLFFGPRSLDILLSDKTWPPVLRGDVNVKLWKMNEVTPGAIAASAIFVRFMYFSSYPNLNSSYGRLVMPSRRMTPSTRSVRIRILNTAMTTSSTSSSLKTASLQRRPPSCRFFKNGTTCSSRIRHRPAGQLVRLPVVTMPSWPTSIVRRRYLLRRKLMNMAHRTKIWIQEVLPTSSQWTTISLLAPGPCHHSLLLE
jgi:hypothetical protein